MIIQGVLFLLSGNHFGSNWSDHGQPHLLHLSCSHLQKDTKERHNCSGYSVLLTDHLLTVMCHFPLFSFAMRLSSPSVRWCFGWVSASCCSALLPPSQFQPEVLAAKFEHHLLQQPTRKTCCYQTSPIHMVKIATFINGCRHHLTA